VLTADLASSILPVRMYVCMFTFSSGLALTQYWPIKARAEAPRHLEMGTMKAKYSTVAVLASLHIA